MKHPPPNKKEYLPKVVDEKSKRKLKAEQQKDKSIFFGFGTFGVVGWSVAVPTVIFTFIGRWLDTLQFGSEKVSWTLTGLFVGLIAGSVIAWRWVNKEGRHPEE